MLPLHPISSAASALPSSVPAGATPRAPAARADWRDDPHQQRLMNELALSGTWTLTNEERTGWEVLRDVVAHGNECLSASSAANPALLLDASDASALHLALASLPAGLFRPRSGYPTIQGLAERLAAREPATLSRGDLDALASALDRCDQLHQAGPLLRRQEALFAQWADDAPTEAAALNREKVCLAILDATARVTSRPFFLDEIPLPFTSTEPARLPPPDTITSVCYEAGKALLLPRMDLHRVADPDEFKQSAEKLQIRELECDTVPLPKGCDLMSLRSINLRRARPSNIAQETLFSMMRNAPSLRLVELPHTMAFSDPLPEGWRYNRDFSYAKRAR